MPGDVIVRSVEWLPTAVVPARCTWPELPALWPALLDEVWSCLRAGGVTRGCRNVMLYLDDEPHVEIGVLLPTAAPLTGRVVRSVLPGGTIATTVHRGTYARLGDSHAAVTRWCRERGRRPAGPRWEIYGPHRDTPAERVVQVAYLLA